MKLLQVIKQANIKLTPIGDKIYRGFCPFHNDGTTPNFTVYENTDSFYCYSCGTGGNLITFLMLFHKITYTKAMELVYGEDYLLSMIQQNNEQIDLNYNIILNKTISKLFLKYKNTINHSIMKELDEDLKIKLDKKTFTKLLNKYKNKITEGLHV